MYNALQRFNHDLQLACILNDAGINEPNDMDVIDAEIIQPDKEMNFRLWFFNLGGNHNFTEEQITIGYQTHLTKWN